MKLGIMGTFSIDILLPVGKDSQAAQMVLLLETIMLCYFLSIKQVKVDLVTYQQCIMLAAVEFPVEKRAHILWPQNARTGNA